MKANKFFSKFTGEEFDEAIEYILSLKADREFKIIGLTVDDKVDLNTLKEEGLYIIHYYYNSYDDTRSSNKIEVSVFNINSEIICQRYDLKGDTVQRYYDVTEDIWSEWAPVKNILSVDYNEEVSVGKPTLVLRHYDGNASEDYTV